MDHKTQITSHYNIFPKIRDFFFLDTEDNIKQFKTTTIKDPEYIYVIYESKKENKIHEKIYRRKDFLSDYEFIRVNKNNPNIYINFIIKQREIRLFSEIKQRKCIMEEIFRKTKINFDTKDSIFFKESFSIKNELKFYNGVFYFVITKQNFVQAPFNQRVNNNNNSFAFNNTKNMQKNISNLDNNLDINPNLANNDNIINNNILNSNRNDNSPINKVDRKGHTGFF
jgi:hypothetical protein